jgi:hypothetical protein
VSTIRVFVNGAPVDVEQGATALDCVRAWNADEAAAIANGKRAITDSRGLEVESASPTAAGSIFRTISKRAAQE